MWIVLLEWDGNKPPTSFYNRLRKMGLHVRGDKEDDEENYISPITRRATSDGSVIVQEGAIICSSESLARYLVPRAEEDGAKVVSVGTFDAKPFRMTTEDAAIFNKIEAVYGRKGRPSGELTVWALTCLEEAKSYRLDETRDAIQCPYCRGFETRARIGEIDNFKFPDGNIFEAWKQHRFVRNQFEVPEETSEVEPPPFAPILHENEKRIVEMMGNSPDFLRQIELLAVNARHTAAKVLDGVLTGRLYVRQETRTEKRVEAVIHLFQRNVSPTAVSLSESHTKVDMLDAAGVIGSEHIAQLWMAVNQNSRS